MNTSKFNTRPNAHLIRAVDRQIARTERLITELLEDLDIEELTVEERLRLSIRLMIQQRYLLQARHHFENDELQRQLLAQQEQVESLFNRLKQLVAGTLDETDENEISGNNPEHTEPR